MFTLFRCSYSIGPVVSVYHNVFYASDGSCTHKHIIITQVVTRLHGCRLLLSKYSPNPLQLIILQKYQTDNCIFYANQHLHFCSDWHVGTILQSDYSFTLLIQNLTKKTLCQQKKTYINPITSPLQHQSLPRSLAVSEPCIIAVGFGKSPSSFCLIKSVLWVKSRSC